MATKIYFAGSIRAGRQDAELYLRIVEQLKTYGHVLTEHVASSTICEVVVAECTQPSLGVGYEIGRAVDLNKKILVLFRPEGGIVLSAMIRGAENGTTFVCKDYKEEDMPEILKNYFGNL